ncbi:helix-turn-helix domain-containing protein [Enterobacter kobei]|uniref:helix-turn-helix domain-containing protein n=1 Tax=Enterobacter kobei TaxID=208224 RepID=UPI00388EE5F8
MPWTETRPMQRLDFIRACHAGTDSFSALCRLFGISRKTGYKWLQRFDPSDLSSLSDRSRAPRSHSRTVPDDIAGHQLPCVKNTLTGGQKTADVAAQSSRRF